jgi:hypothetical protein
MRFHRLQHRVQRAEMLVEGRRQQTLDHGGALVHHWKQAWTPWRIVAVGLGLGFLIGRTRPSRAAGVTQWLRVVSGVSSTFTALRAAMAAWQADKAADKAAEAADSAHAAAGAGHHAAAAARDAADAGSEQYAARAAHDAAMRRAAGMATAGDGGPAPPAPSSTPPPWQGRGQPGSVQNGPPRPAEAATDVSER